MGDGPHNGEFSIIRHGILDDPKFAEVYPDDVRFATWTRLLIEADKTYPSPAAIPYGTKKAPLDHLVKVGLIDRLPHNQFLVHGMAAERSKRAARFKAAADARWKKDHPDAQNGGG